MNQGSLPRRGIALGAYPQRVDPSEQPALSRAAQWLVASLNLQRSANLPRDIAGFMVAMRRQLLTLSSAELDSHLEKVRTDLQRQGVTGQTSAYALAVAAEFMARTLGKRPYETQIQAAWLMLKPRLVEMATGEGKTLAAALAASVAALAGTPVHLLTANDYLVKRDQTSLKAFFEALSIGSAYVVSGMSRDSRVTAWRHDIVYATAKELAFDYLRDHVGLKGERDPGILRALEMGGQDGRVDQAGALTEAIVPGLWFCIVDEADSILLDEAVVPLILSAAGVAADTDGFRHAWQVSQQLALEGHYRLNPTTRTAVLTNKGKARVAEAVAGFGGVLSPLRRAYELVQAALAAQHLYQKDREYVLLEQTVKLIDELTGRIAEGRQWQGPLQAMVEIKEGLPPTLQTTRLAQLTYQALFPRYIRLCGMSGTLKESRREIGRLYGVPVVRVPLAKASQRQDRGVQVWVSKRDKWQAVLGSALEQATSGRPVLIGTDSVAGSTELSSLLTAYGIQTQCLTALQDADEASRIAKAGVAGMVTVATNIAGRGTDIELDERAAESGGLHVIATMSNRARRIDRQLIGRAARHGDPGSVEFVLSLDDSLVTKCLPSLLLRIVALTADRSGRIPNWLGVPIHRIAQRLSEWRDAHLRRELKLAGTNTRKQFGYAGEME